MSDSKLFQTGSSGHFIITNFLSYIYHLSEIADSIHLIYAGNELEPV